MLFSTVRAHAVGLTVHPLAGDGAEEPHLSFNDFEGKYPRYPEFEDIVLSADEREEWVDLYSYMNATPFTIAGSLHACLLERKLRARFCVAVFV